VARACPGLPARDAELLDACLSTDPRSRPGVSELLEAIEQADSPAPSTEVRAASRS
jgi:hypothetical protein